MPAADGLKDEIESASIAGFQLWGAWATCADTDEAMKILIALLEANGAFVADIIERAQREARNHV